MQQTIENIRTKALESIENAVSCDNIEEIRVEFLSRKSELNNIKKNLKDLSNEEKRIIGPLANKGSSISVIRSLDIFEKSCVVSLKILLDKFSNWSCIFS